MSKNNILRNGFELPPSLFEFELIGFRYKIVGSSSSIAAKKI